MIHAQKQTQPLLPDRGIEKTAAFLGLFFGLHMLTVSVGASLTPAHGTVAIFWPASGLVLGFLLITRTAFWPVLILLAMVSESLISRLLGSDQAPWSPVLFAANAGEALLGASLIRHFHPDLSSGSAIRKMVVLIFCAGVFATGLGAAAGAWGMAGMHPGNHYWIDWQIWWFSGAMGVLIITPVVVAMFGEMRGGLVRLFPARESEVLLLFISVVASVYGIFGSPTPLNRTLLDFPFVLFPFLVWAALRASFSSVALLCASTAIATSWLTCKGLGPFGSGAFPMETRVMALQFFLLTLLLMTLFLCAAMGDRRRETAAREQIERRLEQVRRLEMVGRLAGGVAHDFNNYLTVIGGYAEMVRLKLQRAEVRPESFADLSNVIDAVERSSALTGQLLSFSRRTSPDTECLDVRQVLADFSPLLERLVKEKCALSMNIAPDAGFVLTSRTRFEQMILNLVVNARDAMPQGGAITVHAAGFLPGPDFLARFRELTPGFHLRITVSDRGTGIPPEIMDRIFEPFFTTKPDGKGTGIGLSTVFAAVRDAGGAVEVESSPGAGASFHLYLPQASRPHDTPAILVGDVPSAPAPMPGSRKLALVADNEEMLRALVRELLSGKGYEILEAASGRQALELVERGARVPDLLVTDLAMPDMGGLELVSRLSGPYPHMKILIISGSLDATANLDPTLGPSVRFLRKPFSASAFLEEIQRLVTPS